MTSTFEKLVRPYQLGDISPPKPTPSGGVAGDTASQTVELKWGDNSGSAKIMFGSTTLDETFYVVKKMRERKKASTT
jgi:hypothetical protein